MNYAQWGSSLLKELGLWAGVVISLAVGFLWATPWLIVFVFGRGHSQDWFENLLLLCGGLAVISLIAAALFTVGAMRHKVSGGEPGFTIIQHEDTETL